jgi:site-specific DNA-cytosine methylase
VVVDNNLRELNILEYERLQTIPDNYTNAEGVSINQRKRMIGNGWTVDVISHIFKNIV